MCKALKENLPSGCRYQVPQGGFFVWVHLPKLIRPLPLMSLARDAGVEFLPAAFCMPDRSDAPAMRLSFSRVKPDEIEVGIRKLCQVIKDCLRNPDLLKKGAQTYEDLFR